MNHLLAAAALAPVLVACASADAREASADDTARVLIINGERIALGRSGDAASAIEQVLADSQDERVRIQLEMDDSDVRDAGEREAFAEAMAALASGFAHDALIMAFSGMEDADFDLDFEFDAEFDGEVGEADVRRQLERVEARTERHRERMQAHAGHMARHAERLARRAEFHGRGMELAGLEAGLAGMRAGLSGVDRALERGWVRRDGEQRPLSAEERAELEDARNDLARELESMRERLAAARERADGERREVRVIRRDGDVRAFVNGEEVTGSDLDRLLAEEEARLAGAPTPPEQPQAPQE